jgi:hypothetical protein
MMESRTITISRAAKKHGNLNIASCGRGFFPQDVFGSSARNTGMGTPITLRVEGLDKAVKTDIPRDKKTGRPRGIFRERAWVKRFVQVNKLRPNDQVTIERLSKRTYRIRPFNGQITFIDLFAGIGGTRIAFEEAGCKCVFTSEWDKFAQQTYEANFGEKPRGDIRQIPSSEIPDHDILVAGFPCQPFSISGVSKKKDFVESYTFNEN